MGVSEEADHTHYYLGFVSQVCVKIQTHDNYNLSTDMRFYALLLVAVLVRESCCAVWGPKDSPSGVRGSGQRTPQVFELADGENIEDELQEVVKEFTVKEQSGLKRVKRQSAGNNIGYTARLDNDNHYQAVVHWTGHPSEDIFIVTRNVVNGHSTESWLWRSTDYGHTFVNETNKLPSNAIVEWYYISPYSEFLIFSDILLNRLYITMDEGETYTNVTIPFTPDQILFQSTLAPQSDTEPYSKYVLGYDSTAQTLWVSSDLGENWSKIGNDVPSGRFYWRRLDSDIEGDLTTVYYEQLLTPNSNYSMLYKWSQGSQSGELFSADLGQFRSKSFVMEYGYMFVQKPETTVVSNLLSALWVSYNRNTSFVQAMFPFVTEQQHYSIIDASEGQVFIAVYHIGNTSNLYISEELGVSYSLTLQDIVSPPEKDWVDGNPTIDVHVVEGIVGTYFANRHADGGTTGSTVISFDKGGRWNPLTPPGVDRNGRPIVCAPPDCSLHLHMDIDAEGRNYQSILSQDSAIGLIMAQGNLGGALTRSTRSARLYFSRDGGFTWAEVKANLWEFQFAALGSVVVAVQKRRRTSSVLWSCDEGATWTTSSFVDNQFPRGIVVIGMRTEAGEKSRHVTVFGYDVFGGFNEWLVFDLNFTSVVPTQCVQENDYYNWIPTDERPGYRCLLGEVVAYERRNASECCYVDPGYETGVERSHCSCAIEDFECDFGFERQTLNSPCIPYPGNVYPPAPPDPCNEGSNYTYSTGYRKIAGDQCVPGKETYFYPVTVPCPVLSPQFLIILPFPGTVVKTGSDVTFNLTQFYGSVQSTEYRWSFNDSTANVVKIGLASNQGLVHAFSSPGLYTVTVTASNSGGTSDTKQIITVYDVVESVNIILPHQVYQNEVPASIALLFTANVTSLYKSNFLGISEYRWTFGDNTNTVKSDTAAVVYTFANPGTYTVTVNVHAPFVGTSSEADASLVVYQANSVVDILADDNAVQTIQGTKYVTANTSITFHSQTDILVPPDTNYTWHVIQTSSSAGVNITTHDATLEYTFTKWGPYLLSVIGRTELGASFVGQLVFTAEYNLGSASLVVNHYPTARTGTVIVLNIEVRNPSGSFYKGPLQLFLLRNGSSVSSAVGDTTKQKSLITVEVTGRGALDYELRVKNDISSTSQNTVVNVVDIGDYAELTIQFSGIPKTQYNDSSWQSRLLNGVQLAITEIHTDLLSELIELVGVRVVTQNNSEIITKDSNILKRQAGANTVVFVYVDVNILPAEYTSQSIGDSFQFGHMIVTEALNGNLTVYVDKQAVHISFASSRTGGIIIEPPVIIDRFDNEKYAIIGGVLGTILLVAVVITVTLIVIVTFYRRKYTRLNVRYSRLQQTPVRFTFTPGGEMVEEEEDEFDDDGDEPSEYNVNI